MSAYSAAVLADTPVLYLRLGEPSGVNAIDASGNGLNGTYSNTPLLAQAGALQSDADTAVQFRRSQAEDVVVNHNALLNFGGTCSIECWVKRDGFLGTVQALCGKGNGTPQLQFRADNSLYCTKMNQALICHTPAITDALYHHVVGVFLPASVGKIYLDGAAVTIADGAQTIADTASSMRIASQGAGDQCAEVTLDEFAVYNYELPAARVLVHYNTALEQPARVSLAASYTPRIAKSAQYAPQIALSASYTPRISKQARTA